MNQENLSNLKKLIVRVAEFYGRELKPNAVTMMAEILSEFEFEEVNQAYQKYFRESKTNAFPLPSQIIAMIKPSLDPNAKAKELASRIMEAVSKFGWSNQAEAMNFIGPVGEGLVARWGGWSYLCQNLGTTIDLTTFQAQIRDVAEVQFKSSTPLNERAQIEGKSKTQIDSLVKSIIKPV